MEITRKLDLSLDETTLLDMHSVLNILNVVVYEVLQLQEELGQSDELDAVVNATGEIARTLREPAEAYRQVRNADDYVRLVRERIARATAGAGAGDSLSVRARTNNLESVFRVLRVRAAELVARASNPDAWLYHSASDLEKSLRTVLRAIEENSHGGYRIVSNLAAHHEGDYLVHLEISSLLGDAVPMPAVFQDVMRDLLANSRKYTPPGGRITAGLYCNGKRLRFVVEDTGRGIPPGEIERVVEFGQRGSNAVDRPTRGGGFGLTKAYYVTRKFGGRFFVDSTGVPGEGTRIEIALPVPGDMKART